MLQIEIRLATVDDTPLIQGFLQQMLLEMAVHGGYAVNKAPEVWETVAASVKTNLERPEYRTLIAARPEPPSEVVGMVMGYLSPLEPIFIPKTRLHISAVYTVPGARHQGVARQLIQKFLAWGQEKKAVEADLNVLVGNPARHLYEQLGFRPHEMAMTMKLDG